MQVRRRLGVRTWAHPRFEALYSPHLNLLPVSSLLVNPQPDWPDGTEVTGFTWFRTRFLGNAEQAEALKAFCLADEPPIVFAPGGHTRAQPEAFVHASIEASRLLNTRAIIVVSPRHHCPGAADDGRVFFSGYQPYADVFEHARAVVHSAGIGTLGWALRAGKPSVLVPGGWDQFDNADRAQRLGVAKVMSPKAYRGPAIANVLREALRDAALHERVAALRERVAAEDGAEVSAHALETWWHEHRAESLSE
jgi:UDP:flavonoid glycosyltransferase YjiC (YdhE family)